MKKVKAKHLTNDLAQTEIVTLALFLLGGDQRAIDTEDIALKAHELAPGRFSWRKHPEQINLELIRVYLSDAKKPIHGAYLDGSGKTGWTLTEQGLRWAQESTPRVVGTDLERSRAESRAGSIDENRWRRERARLLATAAWTRWSEGKRAIPEKEACEVFRIDSYAKGRMREAKITRLVSMFADEEEIRAFLRHVAAITRKGQGSE